MHPDMKAVKQIDRADKMADGCLNLNQPNIRVIAQPEPSNSHVISIRDIKEFAERELEGLELEETTGGIYAITPSRWEEQTEYWNLSGGCGVFYHSRIWNKTRKDGYEYLSFTRLIKYIVKWISKAGYFYKQSEYSGDIAITVCVYEVWMNPLQVWKMLIICVLLKVSKNKSFRHRRYLLTRDVWRKILWTGNM